MGNLAPAFLRTPGRLMLRAHLSGDLPLKPSLAYVKYTSLLFRKNRRNDAVILRSTLLHPNLPLRKRNAASEGTDPKRQRTNDNGTSTRKYNKAKLGAKQ